MKLKKRIFFTALAVMFINAASATTLSDSIKYHAFAEQVKKVVWAMDLPQFNNTKCPASLKKHSAVILAKYEDINIDRHNKINALDFIFTLQKTLGIKSTYINRQLIAINDEASLKQFSEYDIQAISKDYLDKSKKVLGVKVIKPDGTVNIVNADDYITSTEGKKDKNMRQKLAIPGLQIGDVIDVFIYQLTDMTSYSIMPFNFDFKRNFPLLDYKIHCVFDPALTVQYRTLNGAPDFVQSTDSVGNIVLNASVKDVYDVTPKIGYNEKEQTPLTMMYVCNREMVNTANIKSLQKKGLQANPDAKTIQNDAWNYYKATKQEVGGLFGINISGLSKYRSSLPTTLSDDEKADRLYKYITFGSYTSMYQFDGVSFMHLFDESLTKVGVMHDVILTTDVDKEPVDQLISYSHVQFGIRLANSNRLYFTPSFCAEASFIPYDLSGRKATTREGEYFVIPASTINDNSHNCTMKVSINGTSLDINSRHDCKGIMKAYSAIFLINREYELKSINDYLGLNKDLSLAYGKKNADEVKEIFRQDREKDLDKYKAIIKASFDENPSSVKSYGIDCLGNRSDSTTMTYHLEYTMDGFVKQAGKDLIVSIGKLIGHQIKLEGESRTRNTDIHLGNPYEFVDDITLSLPAGYSVSEESLKKLNTNVSNSCGSFSTNATVEGAALHLISKKCYNHAVEPVANWDKILNFLDAAAAFSDAQIVLHANN
jgi:hypothetical protein